MTPTSPDETVTLTRKQLGYLLYWECGLNRDAAENFWNEALRASLDGEL